MTGADLKRGAWGWGGGKKGKKRERGGTVLLEIGGFRAKEVTVPEKKRGISRRAT